MQDKFGRVFVRANGTGEFVLVKGVQFSNLQLRILSGNHVNTSYNGKKFSLDFSGHRLTAPMLLGANPSVDPDLAMVAYERMLNAAKEMGLINKDRDGDKYKQKCEMIKETSFHILLPLVTAGTKISRHNDFLSKASLLVYLDDRQESFGDFECCDDKLKKSPKTSHQANKTKTLLPYSVSLHLACMVSNLLLAGEEEAALLKTLLKDSKKLKNILQEHNRPDIPTTAKTLDLARDKLNFFSSIRNAVVETGKRNGCSDTALLSLVANVLQAFSLESSLDWQKIVGCNSCTKSAATTSPIPSMVANLRRATASGHLYLEAILFQNGINVEERVRKTKVFKMICNQVDVHFQKVNDLLSFDKEMKSVGNEWRNNEACLLHKMTGLSVEQAKEKVAKDANISLEQIKVLSSLLVNMWEGGSDERKQVERFIKTVEQQLLGHLQFYAFAPRCFDNMVMNGYVE